MTALRTVAAAGRKALAVAFVIVGKALSFFFAAIGAAEGRSNALYPPPHFPAEHRKDYRP